MSERFRAAVVLIGAALLSTPLLKAIVGYGRFGDLPTWHDMWAGACFTLPVSSFGSQILTGLYAQFRERGSVRWRIYWALALIGFLAGFALAVAVLATGLTAVNDIPAVLEAAALFGGSWGAMIAGTWIGLHWLTGFMVSRSTNDR